MLSIALWLAATAGILRGLRHYWYALHGIGMIAAGALIEVHLASDAGTLQQVLLLHLIVIQLSTFLAYGWDKRMARRGGPRLPERTLHALAFIGGTPAAWAGSRYFRHKTIKGDFRKMFWAVVVLQMMALLVAWVVLSSL